VFIEHPGFGPEVASKVLGAVGNPDRFQNRRQVLKLAGFDLCAKRSGKSSENAVPVISRRGKADLRNGLYQAALIASIKNRVLSRITRKSFGGGNGSRGSSSRCG